MYRACSRCGKIHKVGACSIPIVRRYKPSSKGRTTEQKFRSSYAWLKKTREIKERDMYVCRLCLYEGRITRDGLQVHHIRKLRDDYEARLDDDNLITLCHYCHDRVENDIDLTLVMSKLVNIPPYKNI